MARNKGSESAQGELPVAAEAERQPGTPPGHLRESLDVETGGAGPIKNAISSETAGDEMEQLYEAHLRETGQAGDLDTQGEEGTTGDDEGEGRMAAPPARPQDEPEGDEDQDLDGDGQDEGRPEGQEARQPASQDGEQPYLLSFKTREAAEQGFRQTQAWAHGLAQENSQLKAQLAQMQQGRQAPQDQAGQAPARQQGQQPKGEDGFTPLSAEDEAKLFYDDEAKWLAYQAQKQDYLVNQAVDKALGKVNETQTQQAETQFNAQMTDYLVQTYPDMKDKSAQFYVEMELVRMGREAEQKIQAGQLDAEEASFWMSVRQNPTTAIDRAVQNLRGFQNRYRQQGSREARTERERLPVNPVMAPGGAGGQRPQAPPDNGVVSEDAYLRETEDSRRALHPVF